MATENIVIKFSVDKTQLDGAVSSSKTLEAELKKAGVSAEYIDSAMEGVADALNEAGVDAKTFNKALADSATSTKSLKTQLAEAKNEAVRMSQQFGAFSKEAREAAKRAADIKDQIGDLNDTLDALNPEAKLNAFVKLGQGIQGGFQAATGALQVFGVENERITKLAQQFQGVLNLTQGINSVLQLKDVYGQLRLVLGLTTVATEGATAATTGFGAALTATGVGAFVVVIGGLIAAIYALEKSFDDAAEASERLKKKWDDIDAARQVYDKTFNKLLDERIDKLDFEIRKADARGASEKEILKLQIQRSQIIDAALGKAIASGRATQQGEDELIKRRQKNSQELEIQLIKLQKIKEEEAKINAIEKDQAKNKFTKINPLPSPEVIKKQTEEMMDVIAGTIKEKSSDIPPVIPDNSKQIRENIQVASAYGNAVLDIYSAVAEYNNAQYENEKAQIEDLYQRKVITEEQYKQRLRTIRRKQAEDDKQTQLFAAAMAGALALVNALTVTPASAVPAALATAAIVTAINLARIQATPIPKYKTGTLNVGGGNLDSDGGMHAIIHKGEAIIPSDRNRDYHPTIAALFHRKISPSEINGFVQMKLNGKLPDVTARVNGRDIARHMPKNDKVAITNSGVLARQIGRELARAYDPRMR